MRSRVLLSLGVGLSGLGVAVGSVCRPRTTAMSASLSISAEQSETSTVISTSAAEETTLAASTFLDTSSLASSVGTTETIIVESEATSTETAVETTTQTVESTLTGATTTPAETTTTTTSAETTTTTDSPSYPTSFNVVVSGGPADSKTLRSLPYSGRYTLIGIDYGSDIPLSYEPATGRLRLFDRDLYMCAIYNSGSASFATCNTEGDNQPFVICDNAPTKEGNLSCKVPACSIAWEQDDENPENFKAVKTCEPDPWTQFYTRRYTGSPDMEWHVDLGPENSSNELLTPVQIRVIAA
ncbi:hypothetical protein ACLX1H_002903 [Fusarium chlamydosporum]